ncbi:MAG: dihydroorotase [Mycoplasmatales bacterium]
MKYVLQGGYIIDKNNNKRYVNILIENKEIQEISSPTKEYKNIEIISIQDKLIVPGLVDVHVHFREPGQEYKEDLQSGAKAAQKGGYTQVFAMPNTNPVLDSAQLLEEVKQKCSTIDLKIEHYGAITKSLNSAELVDMEAMQDKCIGFTNDGVGVQTAGIMYEAQLQAKKLEMPIIAHCEDMSLVYGGVLHEGTKNKALGYPGILSISESLQLSRDIELSRITGCKYHACHMSTTESVTALALAKKNKLNVSGEVSPHHLLLTEDDVVDASFKMNPPLRSQADRASLIWAIQEDIINIIATDHAPHSEAEKEKDILEANFGIIGLEHAFSLCYTELVQKEIISLRKLIELMSYNPRMRFNLENGLEIGDSADLTIIDLEQSEIITKDSIVSKGKNTPFIGKKVKGLVELTIVDGKVVYERK